MMMEEVPNIVSIPILCHDNETQGPCVSETTSSELYVKKFGHKGTWEENYRSRIRGRIFSNSERDSVTEDSFAMELHYSKECAKTCD
ncbi:hypothetical protein MKW92_050158, partial [Papaver armeniacum]